PCLLCRLQLLAIRSYLRCRKSACRRWYGVRSSPVSALSLLAARRGRGGPSSPRPARSMRARRSGAIVNRFSQPQRISHEPALSACRNLLATAVRGKRVSELERKVVTTFLNEL